MLGSKVLFDTLVKNKINHVFGYSGGAILPVLNEFYDQNKIKFIMSRTELGGSFMAEGYGKAMLQSGEKIPGVVMTTSGPGALNIVTSLQNAFSDGTPLLALSGQVSTKVLGTQAFQEANVIDITKKCTKWNNQIQDGTIIESTVDYAFNEIFYRRCGPVLLDLPKNIMSEKFIQRNYFECKNDKLTSYYNINEILLHELILRSKKPVILAGQGILNSNTVDLLRSFSLYYNIPVTTTLLGLGSFDENNLLSLKMIGMHGSYYANMAVQNSDLILNFGSRFDDRITGNPSYFAPDAIIVHNDIDFYNINKTINTQYFINADIKIVLNNLLRRKEEKYSYNINQEWINQIREWKKIDFNYTNKDNLLQGRHVLKVLNEIIYEKLINLNTNYTLVADVGAHQMWTAQFINYNFPRVKLITSGGLGSMGYALPASIGIKIAKPHEEVICICGDGGFTMSMIEILTAIENNIKIKVLILNNNYQLMVQMWQKKFYQKRIIGTAMRNPNFEEIVKSMGCYSVRIDYNSNLKEELKKILEYSDGPIIANILTDENETVLPMVVPGEPLDNMVLSDDESINSSDVPC